jgi:hypothetical protein
MILSEIGDQVQSAAEGLDVAGDDLEGGDLAVLDLDTPSDGHAHGDSDLLFAQTQMLARLGELVPARLGEPQHALTACAPPFSAVRDASDQDHRSG